MLNISDLDFFRSGLLDSNQRPRAPQTCALPTALNPETFKNVCKITIFHRHLQTFDGVFEKMRENNFYLPSKYLYSSFILLLRHLVKTIGSTQHDIPRNNIVECLRAPLLIDGELLILELP